MWWNWCLNYSKDVVEGCAWLSWLSFYFLLLVCGLSGRQHKWGSKDWGCRVICVSELYKKMTQLEWGELHQSRGYVKTVSSGTFWKGFFSIRAWNRNNSTSRSVPEYVSHTMLQMFCCTLFHPQEKIINWLKRRKNYDISKKGSHRFDPLLFVPWSLLVKIVKYIKMSFCWSIFQTFTFAVTVSLSFSCLCEVSDKRKNLTTTFFSPLFYWKISWL